MGSIKISKGALRMRDEKENKLIEFDDIENCYANQFQVSISDRGGSITFWIDGRDPIPFRIYMHENDIVSLAKAIVDVSQDHIRKQRLRAEEMAENGDVDTNVVKLR